VQNLTWKSGFYVFLIFVVLLFPVPSPTAHSSSKLTIYVVNYPLKYFAARIAGDSARVVFPAPAGVDPAYWMPDAKTISRYQSADLILLNGANYAGWVRKVTLPRSRTIDTSAKFKTEYIVSDQVVTHSHGPEGRHAHESLAFTTWLDFSLAARQAMAITKCLSRKMPEQKAFFEKNHAAFEAELLALDAEMKAITTKKPTLPLVASHPVYDYVSRRYALNMISVHWEPDEVPSGAQWSELRALLRRHPAKWMVWEGTPGKASVEGLKAMGLGSLVFAPCGNRPEQGDFMGVMRQNIINLRRAFQ